MVILLYVINLKSISMHKSCLDKLKCTLLGKSFVFARAKRNKGDVSQKTTSFLIQGKRCLAIHFLYSGLCRRNVALDDGRSNE